MASIQEALLLQQLEFLTSNIEEANKREGKLQEQRRSLMELANSLNSNDQTLEGLQKMNEKYQEDLKVAKTLQNESERTISSLRESNQRLSLELKQTQLEAKNREQELVFQVKTLQNDIARLEKLVKASEEDKQQALNMNDLSWEVKLRQLKEKYKKKLENDENLTLTKAFEQAANLTTKSAESDLSKTQLLNHQLNKAEIEIEHRNSKIKEMGHRQEKLRLEHCRAEVEKTRALIELKQHKLDHCISNKGNEENKLKIEIKGLVGSLMNAKNRVKKRRPQQFSVLNNA